MARLTRSSWIKIVLIALLCIVVCGGLLSCSYGCNAAARHASNIAERVHQGVNFSEAGNFEVPAQDVRSLEISWLAGSVDIVVVDDDESNPTNKATITAVEEFNGTSRSNFPMAWQLNNGLLQISYGVEHAGLTSCSHSDSKRLIITLPRSVAQSLQSFNLSAASGTYNIQSLKCEQMNISLASGRIEGSNIVAQDLDLDIASGNVLLSGNFPGSLDVRMASGNSEIASKDTCPAFTSLDIASGQMLLFVPKNSGLTANIRKISGSFNCNLEASEQTNGSRFVYGDGSSSLNVDMASGNVTVSGQ